MIETISPLTEEEIKRFWDLIISDQIRRFTDTSIVPEGGVERQHIGSNIFVKKDQSIPLKEFPKDLSFNPEMKGKSSSFETNEIPFLKLLQLSGKKKDQRDSS